MAGGDAPLPSEKEVGGRVPNRILKEAICISEDIEALSYFQEIFFYRLIVNCDDFGRFDGRTAILKARLFPLKDVKDKEIETTLEALCKIKLIEMYTVEGKSFIQMLSWKNHQQIRNKKSKFPSPEDGEEIIIAETPSESTTKKKKEPVKKTNYAEFVKMTEEEHGNLITEHGEQVTQALIKKLDDYKGSTGKTYKSDYRTMLGWVIEAVTKDKPQLFNGQPPTQSVVDPNVNPYG